MTFIQKNLRELMQSANVKSIDELLGLLVEMPADMAKIIKNELADFGYTLEEVSPKHKDTPEFLDMLKQVHAPSLNKENSIPKESYTQKQRENAKKHVLDIPKDRLINIQRPELGYYTEQGRKVYLL